MTHTQIGGAKPWDLLVAITCWGALPIVLSWTSWSVLPLATVVLVGSIGCTLGVAHRAGSPTARAERSYARVAGAIAALPVGLAFATIVSALAQYPEPSLAAILVASATVGAVAGPRLASRLAGSAWWTLPATPIATASLVYISALLALAHGGRWPRYGDPDPAEFHGQVPLFELLDVVSTVGVIFTPFSPLALLLLVPYWFRNDEPGAGARRASRIFTVAFLVWMAFISVDPGGAVDWLLD